MTSLALRDHKSLACSYVALPAVNNLEGVGCSWLGQSYSQLGSPVGQTSCIYFRDCLVLLKTNATLL
jgi:hypothetical protein